MKKIPYIEEGGFLGGSLLGEITTSYENLVKKLGKPNRKNDGYKVDAEWLFFTGKGHGYIYNYKTGKNYLGKEGQKTKDITCWHIGGENKEVVQIIADYLLT